MPTKLMEALCGKEKREHWKNAWKFEMYRAILKQTWEDVEEEEYKARDIADLVNSFKKQQIFEDVKPITGKYWYPPPPVLTGTPRY